MSESVRYEDWVDRYVQHRLSEEEEAEFETALLESPELQQSLETALALHRTLKLAEDLEVEVASDAGASKVAESPFSPHGQRWQPFAMAASVVLAVFSTVMYWRTGVELSDTRTELESLKAPFGSVLTVPVDIMRSASTQEPDVIVRKPDGRALVVLDIEVLPAFTQLTLIHITLRNEDGSLVTQWQAGPPRNGQLSTAIDSALLPIGKVWLELLDASGTLSDRRLVEFR